MRAMASVRADALRNRAAILSATERLVARLGPQRLRVADVVREAGVGPGTLYRAYQSKSALLLALLDERERVLQEQILRGAPPLGPGAPAAQRLVAFVVALHELTAASRDVLVAAEEGSVLARYHTGAHAAWRLHLAVLLRELRPDANADVLAELLLAPLAAGLHAHMLDERGVTQADLRAELIRLAEAIAHHRNDTSAATH